MHDQIQQMLKESAVYSAGFHKMRDNNIMLIEYCLN